MFKAEGMPAVAAGLDPDDGQRIAVLVPCFNEEVAIAKVVADFRAALPEATVYVYDNNSTDRTAETARRAGAVVGRETHQGKGNVVRRMFADVDADVIILVDGDATYDAGSVRALIARLIQDRLDMVVAARIHHDEAAFRMAPSHEGFHARDAARGEVQPRLVVQQQLVALDGAAQALLHREALVGELVHLRGVELERVAALALGAIHRRVCVLFDDKEGQARKGMLCGRMGCQ